jgi:hypothetical protein
MPALDQYGGFSDLPVPGGGTGYFRVAKVNNRWVFVTPDGNAFWLCGVFNCSLATLWDSKYTTQQQWANTTTRRMQAWGLNGFNISPLYHAIPQAAGGDAGNIPFPYTYNIWPSHYGLTNSAGGLVGTPPGAFHGIFDGLDGTYTGFRRELGDFFAPNYDAYVQWRANAWRDDPFWGPKGSSPWHLGFTTDDMDSLFGFGGPDPAHKGPDGQSAPHPGWLTIATNPNRASSTQYGVSYADPKVYSKYQLQAQLQAKYGTIGALNSAWGSTYTTWDSDTGGWGVGDGWLDENGRHTAWLGTTNANMTTANANVKIDFDLYLYDMANKYGTVLSTRLKSAFPNHLVLGPNPLNGHFGVSRAQVLKGLADTIDVCSVAFLDLPYLQLTMTAMGDRPVTTREGFVANPDSSMHAFGMPSPQPWTYPTQAARDAGYGAKMNLLLTGLSAEGNYNTVGMSQWEWHDNNGEKLNWGFVSLRENAYDGIEAVVAVGTDPYGFPTGGEDLDYGNYISSVTAANATIFPIIQASFAGGTAVGTPSVIALHSGIA